MPEHRRGSLFRDAWRELHDVFRFRALVRALVATSLRTETIGTVFGYLWWLIDPLLLMAVYYVLVGVIFERGGENFAVFLFTSVIVWKYFQAGTRNAIAVTVGKERQMRQIRFPKIVLPLSSILVETVRFAFALVVLIAVGVAFGLNPHYTLPLVLVVAAVQFTFTLGVAFFLSALNVFFRDVNHLAGYAFQAWFFLSPGIYTIDLIPEKYRSIYELNPFATIFPAYHAIVVDHAVPDFSALAIVAGVSVAVLVFGYLFFVRLEPLFAKVN